MSMKKFLLFAAAAIVAVSADAQLTRKMKTGKLQSKQQIEQKATFKKHFEIAEAKKGVKPVLDKTYKKFSGIVKASDIKRFFKKITEGRTISRKNFVNIKSIFNVVYDLAVESDIVANNLSRNLNCKDLKFKAVDNENVRYTDEDRDKILNYLDGMDEKTGYEYGIELMFTCASVSVNSEPSDGLM